MRRVAKLIAITIFLISLLVGVFPAIYDSFLVYLLYILIFLLSLISLIYNLKPTNKGSLNYKLSMVLVVIVVFLLVGIIFRENKASFYAISFACMLSAYYALVVADIDDDTLKKLSYLVSFVTIPTLVFNGFLASNIDGGTAFLGRLNPLFYLPYLLIALKNVSDKKEGNFGKRSILYWVLLLEMILIFVDLWWSGSRIAIISAGLILLTLLVYDRKKFAITKKIRFGLRTILIFALVFHVVFPVIYVNLSEEYEKELNQYSNSITSKSFFSGRQKIWKKIYKITSQDNKIFFGTGDANYTEIEHNPHNDFMGIYYLWGGIVSGLVYLYIFIVGNKCIEKMRSRNDLIIVLSFITFVVCSSSEAIMYVPCFFIFEKILVANLLGKENICEAARIN